MAGMEFKAKFNAHGFVPGVDISYENWQTAISEFIIMQDQFVYMSNQILEKVNGLWEKYEHIKKLDEITGSCMATFQTQKSMGIDEKTTYNDWIEMWYKDVCEAVDSCAELSGFHLKSNLFRDGDMPVFGAKFKDRPEWTVDLSLEPVEA